MMDPLAATPANIQQLVKPNCSSKRSSLPGLDVVAATLIAVGLFAFVFLAPHELSRPAAITFLLTGLAIVGWTLTPIPDSVVAISAALGLVLTGALPEERFYAALGTELVWLLISAFVIAAAIKSSGLTERFAQSVVKPFSTVNGFFHALTFVVSATVFLIPSTSGRAALLLPVFVSLAPVMPTPSLRRALALLFPSAILLSAGGSLIGAGAHFIAVETIQTSTGLTVSFLEWILLALPVALLASHGATVLILLLFVPPEERRLPLCTKDRVPEANFSGKHKKLMCLLGLLIAAWVTSGIHGIGIAIIGCVGAALVVTPLFTDEKPKALFKNVETELLVFLASTWVIAQAVVSTGKAKWLADKLLFVLPLDLLQHREFVILVTIVIATAAHLVINSRSARAAVLIPSLALPLAEFGHDTMILVMATVLGTGYCQTMVASAKPIAIFKSAGDDLFGQKDLFRLAMPLLPLKVGLIAAFAMFIWPLQSPSQSVNDAELSPTANALRLSNPDPVRLTALQFEPQEPMRGALCTRTELEALMLATIYERRMWAAGWWHVWDRLRKDGVPIEKSAVRDIYKSQDMVRLRSHSLKFAEVNLEAASVTRARMSCSGKPTSNNEIVPTPRKKP